LTPRIVYIFLFSWTHVDSRQCPASPESEEKLDTGSKFASAWEPMESAEDAGHFLSSTFITMRGRAALQNQPYSELAKYPTATIFHLVHVPVI
jgi:hypothetical protein